MLCISRTPFNLSTVMLLLVIVIFCLKDNSTNKFNSNVMMIMNLYGNPCFDKSDKNKFYRIDSHNARRFIDSDFQEKKTNKLFFEHID